MSKSLLYTTGAVLFAIFTGAILFAQQSGEEQWNVNISGALSGEMAANSNYLVVPTEGAYYGYNRKTGERLWRTPANYTTDTGVVGSNAIIKTNSHIVSVAMETGNENWETNVPGQGRLTVSNEEVFVRTTSHLYKLSARSGQLLWRKNVPARTRLQQMPRPTVYEDSVYVLSSKGLISFRR